MDRCDDPSAPRTARLVAIRTDAARIARSYLNRIENGKKTPSVGVLEKIAAALSVPMSAFFDERVEVLADGFGRELLSELMALEPQQRALHALAIMVAIAEPAPGRLKTAA